MCVQVQLVTSYKRPYPVLIQSSSSRDTWALGRCSFFQFQTSPFTLPLCMLISSILSLLYPERTAGQFTWDPLANLPIYLSIISSSQWICASQFDLCSSIPIKGMIYRNLLGALTVFVGFIHGTVALTHALVHNHNSIGRTLVARQDATATCLAAQSIATGSLSDGKGQGDGAAANDATSET